MKTSFSSTVLLLGLTLLTPVIGRAQSSTSSPTVNENDTVANATASASISTSSGSANATTMTTATAGTANGATTAVPQADTTLNGSTVHTVMPNPNGLGVAGGAWINAANALTRYTVQNTQIDGDPVVAPLSLNATMYFVASGGETPDSSGGSLSVGSQIVLNVGNDATVMGTYNGGDFFDVSAEIPDGTGGTTLIVIGSLGGFNETIEFQQGVAVNETVRLESELAASGGFTTWDEDGGSSWGMSGTAWFEIFDSSPSPAHVSCMRSDGNNVVAGLPGPNAPAPPAPPGAGIANIPNPPEFPPGPGAAAQAWVNGDADNDIIPDAVEEILGTNPNNADTDGDGLEDGEEYYDILTDPLNPDTDGGGVNDGDEYWIDFTDPLDPTDDGNGYGY